MKRREFLGILGISSAVSLVGRVKPKERVGKAVAVRRGKNTYMALANDKGEISGGGYERAEISPDAWTTDERGIVNCEAIHFPQATGEWGEVKYFEIYPTKRGGKPVIRGSLDYDRHIGELDMPGFQSFDVVIT